MPKINPFSESRPAVKSALSPEFAEPGKPHLVLQMELRVLDDPEKMKASDLAQYYIGRYVGDYRNGTEPTARFPFIDGRPVAISETACYLVAELVYAQTSQGDDAYTFDQLMGVSAVAPKAFSALLKWYRTELKGDSDPKDWEAFTAR
jgi:hypothetical protein